MFGIIIEFPKCNIYKRYLLSFCVLITTTCIFMVNSCFIKGQREVYSLILNTYDNHNKSFEERKHAVFSCVFPFINDAVTLFFSTGPYLILVMSMINGSLKRMRLSLIAVEKAFQAGKRFHRKVKKKNAIKIFHSST